MSYKYKVRSDGRTAYERITGHKARQQAIGVAESVDFILESNKKNMHRCRPEHVASRKTKNAAERGVDSWMTAGEARR